MVKKTQVILIDDIDGSPADETVTFALDGVSYEIDLTSARATELREALASWVGHARRAGGTRTPARRGGSSSGRRPSRNPETQKIREWARENGFTVSERGRISADVAAAYEAAH